MKKLFFLLSIVSFSFFVACDKDDDDHDHDNTTEFAYHAHIMSPDSTDKHLNDTIHLHINFEDHDGNTLHNVNVRIFNQADNTEVYNAPADSHIHEMSGSYEWHDDVILSEANGFSAHSDWTLEAKVWGMEDGASEVIESVDFHVHPE
ncbi:MAG: hypothetical protein ACPG5B_00785 [Chitinophagales bacterium]